MRGLGYLISIVSVLMLGLVAMPGTGDPTWHLPVVLGGMAASIAGMALRWLSSRRQAQHLAQVERQIVPD